MAKLLLQNRSFIRCRKETQEKGHCKNAKKTMETQIQLTKTAIELARLDNRGNITKAKISRNHKTQSSLRKHDNSSDTVQNRKSTNCPPAVNNKIIQHINSTQNHGRIDQSVRASC